MPFLALMFVVGFSNLSVNGWSTAQLIELARIIGLLVFTLWLFSIGLALNRIGNNPHKFNERVLELASLCFFVGYASLGLSRFPELESVFPVFGPILIMPLTVFGLVYLFYNIPVSLRSLELGRKAKYSECLLDAILFFSCASGIGFWWLQPRMNRIAEQGCP